MHLAMFLSPRETVICPSLCNHHSGAHEAIHLSLGFSGLFEICEDVTACFPTCNQHHLYLQERFFLFKVLAYHRGHVICFRVGTQFVCSPTPVFFPLIFLLQTLQHTANLPAKRRQISLVFQLNRTVK